MDGRAVECARLSDGRTDGHGWSIAFGRCKSDKPHTPVGAILVRTTDGLAGPVFLPFVCPVGRPRRCRHLSVRAHVHRSTACRSPQFLSSSLSPPSTRTGGRPVGRPSDEFLFGGRGALAGPAVLRARRASKQIVRPSKAPLLLPLSLLPPRLLVHDRMFPLNWTHTRPDRRFPKVGTASSMIGSA